MKPVEFYAKLYADESPEVLRALKVMGIPATIGFAYGTEIILNGWTKAEPLD